MPAALYLQDAHSIRHGMGFAAYAEARGFDAVWQAESRLVRESTVPLAAYAAVTDRIKVGSGVADIWSRNPARLAATFSTLDDLAPGRVLLGLGAWWDPLAAKVGIHRARPLTVMREVVTVVRALLHNDNVTFHGHHVHLDGVELDYVYQERRPKDVPIYIGATGMQMMELAGEIADGVVLNYLVSPDYNAKALEHLDAGLTRSGRKLEDFDRPQLVVCSVHEDEATAIDRARLMVTQYLGQQPHIMAASGVPQTLLDEVGAVLTWPATHQQIEVAAKLVPDDIVRMLTASGTPAQARARVADYLAQGCTCPILYPLGDVTATIDAFAGMVPVRVVVNPLAGRPDVWSPYTRDPLAFHQRLPGYQPTPLLDVPWLAAQLRVGRLLVKHERSRWGLPAFKMLGASWAAYRAVVERAEAEPPWRTIDELQQALRPLRPLTLAAPTDGNHGRAVACMARLLGFDAHIFVPADMGAARIDAIAGEGATVTVVDGDYDQAVAQSADVPGCLVISDTSWPGYEQVPRWVIEGYSTMFWEISDRLAAAGGHAPDVIVVPIGVGALAAAAVNHFARDGSTTAIVGVEPIDANCVMASAEAGGLTTVCGPHRSIMVGLNCGNPSPVAWLLVSKGVAILVATDDDAARQAVRDLLAAGIEAGETGAAGLAGLTSLQAGAHRISDEATVLVVCTEGATDPDAWRRILGVQAV